ncbi:uncharacterized protein LOC105688254 [Athalia rosae]|uniref:uncharacterized protein LOC105688254 n=1 Tax=Athalia rosae TaxID=37344 RepID=UPI0020349D74|nr:uncharacterized protein LOC105688254 [Athalia rosae]
MSTVKMKHVKSSLDRIGFRFPRQDSLRGRKNDVDDYKDEIFLEASLQFLYSLLAERTTTIKKTVEKLNETAVPPNIFGNLKSRTDSYASTSVRLFSSPNYGEYDIGTDIEEPNIPVEKLTPNTTRDLQNPGIRESISYANIVRNAVSRLATNCKRKRTSKTKIRLISANSLQGSNGLPETVGISFKGRRNRSSSESSFRQSNVWDHECKAESDVPSETVSSSLPAAPKERRGSNAQAKRKLRLVPTILNLLRGGSKRTCCTSSICVDLLEKDQIEYSPSDSNVTSINFTSRRPENFVRNDEKNTRRNKLINMLRNVSNETRMSINNDDGSRRRNTIGKFSLMHADILPPTKVNPSSQPPQQTKMCNVKVQATAVGCSKCDLVNRKPSAPTRPEIICDKLADEIPKGVRNYSDEITIPLRYSQDSPWLDWIENVGAEKISQNDVDTLHGLAAEIRRIRMRRHPVGELRTEIPVKIKTTQAPLHLRKTDQVSTAKFWEQRDFEIKTKSHRVTTTDGFQVEKFVQLLDETLPEGINYFPLHSNKNEGVCRMQDKNLAALNSMREKSALQVLFRQIATDASIISESIELKSCGNNDKNVPQTAPKRQSSKISVCSYSSEGLSGSDQESPDFRMKSTSTLRDEETEIIIVEENGGSALPENSSSSALVAHRGSEKSTFCSHSVLREKIHNLDDKKLSNDVMGWWAPNFNYSTTPSPLTQYLSITY